MESARSLIDQRHHELTVSFPSEPIWLEADAARLVQVVSNLLTNSAKYTEEGGRIWLTVVHDRDEAVLGVRDTGMGIDPELLPRIFDLFTQADETLARPQAGLGVGLALVKAIVDLHGGMVTAHSPGVGQGSEFIVRLPIALSPGQQPSSSLGAPAASRTGPLRVLVVDDNADLTRMFELVIQTMGHQVRRAHTGPEVLEIAPEYRPDVVLLDVGLPGLDGYEVAMRMRRDNILRDVVLVAVTGYGRDEDRLRSREAGFDHHLVKPVDLSTLEQLLEAISYSRAT